MLIPTLCLNHRALYSSSDLFNILHSPFQLPQENSPAIGEAREWTVRTGNALQENLLRKEYPIHSCDKDEGRLENVTKLIHSPEKANKEKNVSSLMCLVSSACNSHRPGLHAPVKPPDFTAFGKVYL